MNKRNPLKEYKFIIFDWDGTLMDSTARIVSCMQKTAEVIGYEIPSVEQVKGIIGLSMDAVIERIFPEAGEEHRSHVKDVYRQYYVELDQTPSPLFKGTMPLLESLKTHEVSFAVATGKARAGLNRALSSVSMLDYFNVSICADEAQSKPHPEMVNRLLNSAGHSIDETLVIGDSVHDLGMAQQAGVDAVGVTSGANTKDELALLNPIFILDQLEELTNKINCQTKGIICLD